MRLTGTILFTGVLLCHGALAHPYTTHDDHQRVTTPTMNMTVAQTMQHLWPGDLTMPAVSQHGDVALVSWHYQATGQAAKHGRALWRKLDGKWQFISCAGKSLLDSAYLVSAGVTTDTAKTLVQAHKMAEASLPASEVELFDSFMAIHPSSANTLHP